MVENAYTFKVTVGTISVDVTGPKEFVEPIYNIFKPLLEKEVKARLKGEVQHEKKTDDRQSQFEQFPKKASLREFYQQKRPKSDIQAATLVAFFYSELAESEEKKSYIDRDILNNSLKQTPHGMLKNPDQTLRNAKFFGYLDSAGDPGRFKLTPTGFNLIAHTLPSDIGDGAKPRTKTRKKVKKTQRK